jgi:hypothetical protein
MMYVVKARTRDPEDPLITLTTDYKSLFHVCSAFDKSEGIIEYKVFQDGDFPCQEGDLQWKLDKMVVKFDYSK